MAQAKQQGKPARTRRSYSQEFKQEAVQMLLDGHSAPSVAERLGLAGPNLLYLWKKQILHRAGPAAQTLGSRVAQLEDERPYIMDFTYLYAEAQADFVEFSAGKPFTEEQVYAEIGRPEDWTHRHAQASTGTRTDEQAALVAQQLAACAAWQPIVPDSDLD